MGSADFNVSVVVAFVLAGIAALVLATVLALGGYGRPARRAALPGANGAVPTASATASALPEVEFEYVPDTTEPVPAAR